MIYAFEKGRNDVDFVYLLAGYCNASGINNKFNNVFLVHLNLVYNTSWHFAVSLRSSLVV